LKRGHEASLDATDGTFELRFGATGPETGDPWRLFAELLCAGRGYE
jgi:hypothetical protein